MDYKLIALDIDGTLTNSQKEITPRTRYALMEAQKQGKKIILASGRHPVGIMPIAKDLMLDRFGGFIMAFNGGRIINCETGETMVSKLFPLEYLPDIVNVLKDSNITINTYDDRRIISDNKVNDYTYVERDVIKAEMVVVDDFISSVRFDINKILLAGEPDELDKYQKILADRYDGLLDVYKSMEKHYSLEQAITLVMDLRKHLIFSIQIKIINFSMYIRHHGECLHVLSERSSWFTEMIQVLYYHQESHQYRQ